MFKVKTRLFAIVVTRNRADQLKYERIIRFDKIYIRCVCDEWRI